MFAANISEQSSYWDTSWQDRIKSDGVHMNIEKMCVVMNYIADREWYRDAGVLDVGCGTGIHAYHLVQEWPDLDWTGIDISPVAIEQARTFGLKAQETSIYDYAGEKYGAFWFLDSLEHMEDHERVASSIRRLAKKKFRVFGNVPLYSQTDHSSKCERSIGVNEIAKFVSDCGLSGFHQRIYGVNGHPYMIFEAS